MTVHLSSPEQLMQPVPYAHVAVSTGTRHIDVAGQVARDAHGGAAAQNLAGQVASTLRNVAHALHHAGATFSDVTRLTIYLTDIGSESMGELMAGIAEVTEELGLPSPLPPSTVVGVAALYEPDVLVEIQAAAVSD